MAVNATISSYFFRSNPEKKHLVKARGVPHDTTFTIHRPGENWWLAKVAEN